MQITVDLPVLFRGKALRGDGIKTMLTFVPTTLDIAEVDPELAPLVASVHRPLENAISHYRSFGGTLYGRLTHKGPNGPDDGAVIIKRIHRNVARKLLKVLHATRIDDLYPKDARELLGMSDWDKPNGYPEYLERIRDRMAARNMTSATTDNPDFIRGYNSSLEVAKREALQHIFVDGGRYNHTAGLNIKVESHYNNTVKVSVEEPWSGELWRQELDSIASNSAHRRSHYFSVADEEGARAFAEKLAAKLDQPVVEWEHTRRDTVLFHTPVEALPHVDWTYAEVVRSAKDVCHVVGMEIARRFRNQEKSIFTDDPALRYAFDRLREVLRDADPFGEPDDRIEVEATRLLAVIEENKEHIDTRYRNLASENVSSFEHLKMSLDRFENRDVEIGIVLGNQPRLAQQLL